MKHILKMIGNGMLLGVGIFIVLGIGYLSIKARQTTNPGLTEQSPTGGLYVNNNETLSAAKRNALVAKQGGLNIKILTGTTAVADSTTFAHGLNWNKIIEIKCIVKYNGVTFHPMSRQMYSTIVYSRLTNFDATNVIINYNGDALYRNQEYRCIITYTD